MNDFFSYLIPIIFLINSFFIGKLVQKKYSSMNNALSFVSGSILLFSGISIINILFIFASDLISFFPYAILVFQIILVVLYFINWKKCAFSLLPNWNKLITFIFVFFVLSIPYFLFIYSNQQFIFWLNTKASFSIFWNAFNNKILFYANMSYQSVNSLYKIWFPIFLLFISASCVYDFLNVTSEFDWKKYLIGLFVAFLFGLLIFNNISIIKNGYSLVFIYSIVLLSFFTSKLDSNDIFNYQFVFNASIIFFILLDSSFLFFSAFLFIWYALFLYSKRIDFSLDMVTRSLLYLLCGISFFFIRYLDVDLVFSIVIFSILFVVFLCLISLYSVSRKNNDNYFYKTFLWENKIHPNIRYVNLVIFLLITIIPIILIFQNTISFNATDFTDMFQITKINRVSLSFYNAIQIIFYVFYSFVLFFAVVNFFVKLKSKEVKGNSFLLTNITIILINPLFICLLNSFSDELKNIINTDLLLIFYLFFVFVMFSKKILYLPNSSFKKQKNNLWENKNQQKILNLNHFMKSYIANDLYFSAYVFLTIFFISSFLVFSYI